MALPTSTRLTSRRTGLMLCLGFLTFGGFGYAQPQSAGRIISRDGTPQPGCQVDFRVGNERRYVATSGPDGRFYVNANPGTYTVLVMRGSAVLAQVRVTVDERGLHPSTFVI